MGGTARLTRVLPRAVSAALIAGAAAMGSSVLIRDAQSAQEPPQRSIFEISVWESAQNSWRGLYSGTAFFIAPDGTALTASHIVYRVRGNRKYRLMAIQGREFYSASLICASDLQRDPAASSNSVRTVRDVAEVRVIPSEFPFDQITYKDVPFAHAHHGPLPSFPALSLGPDPNVGDRVRVLGFGAAKQPLPYEWSADGEITRKADLSDGTPGFNIIFDARPVAPGHSGSPVLDATGQVVGMLDWLSEDDPQLATAVSSLALTPACP